MPVYTRSQHHYYSRSRESVKALVFALGLVLMLMVFVMGMLSSGPIILGTEMNANGTVEYMCLGSDCEDLSTWHWSDK